MSQNHVTSGGYFLYSGQNVFIYVSFNNNKLDLGTFLLLKALHSGNIQQINTICHLITVSCYCLLYCILFIASMGLHVELSHYLHWLEFWIGLCRYSRNKELWETLFLHLMQYFTHFVCLSSYFPVRRSSPFTNRVSKSQ